VSKDDLILHRILYKLWHIDAALEQNAEEIKERSKALVGLRKDKAAADKALEDKRRAQANARNTVTSKEKKLKKAEKHLESKVLAIPLFAVGAKETHIETRYRRH